MIKPLFIITVFITLSFSANTDAKNATHNVHKDFGTEICKKEKLAKIFPSPEQLIIQSDSIYIHSVNTKKILQGKFIALEDGQLYVAVRSPEIVEKRGPCGLHKVYHKACGGCGVLLCPMNCTCFD